MRVFTNLFYSQARGFRLGEIEASESRDNTESKNSVHTFVYFKKSKQMIKKNIIHFTPHVSYNIILSLFKLLNC